MKSIWSETSLALSGATADGALGAAARGRMKVLEMTAAAEQAVLAPADPGGVPHDLRAAYAARIAYAQDETALAARYAARMNGPDYASLVDPAQDGAALGLAAQTRFMDRAALRTRDVAASDIDALREAGVDEADIVRLAELNAFLAYQLRVVAGLRLMAGASA